MQLDGRRIIVTGGAQGIGAALVAAYVREGARVGSLDLQREEGEAVVAAATGPGRATFRYCDVSDRVSVDAAIDAFVDDLGGLDLLVNVAGIERRAPAEEIDPAEWEHVFAVNATGTLYTNQAAFRHLREHGGAILNFASGAAVRGYPNGAHYAAAKGAVLSWTRTVAMEWGRYGITVNALCPGVETPMAAAARERLTPEQHEEARIRMAANTPIDGKLGDPDRDLVPFLVFLASPGARFITGQTLVVDGGRTMVR
ncbi:SDR family oxidoreductase [Pseudonocardia kujensis]|uniref:SDR family NAD(P)-dependent oxidoreductase n=1 Tax=Pseudonocardia kujensis TaxID=1128675 RepID=UPI001E5AB4AA|nr:SDR family NAD(P)-dependent oxidoreductase [Pseudonocardia kujensis]MCE0767803.1 SDR family oxidoreductase [Pseudonocardia kujensis]